MNTQIYEGNHPATISTATVQHLDVKPDLLEQCKEIAHAKDVLSLLISDLNAAGAIGEERIAQLVYLALQSRWADRPVSIAVKGPSSAGKSFTTENALKFVPSDAYHVLTAMSPKALVYSEEPLKHRFLVLFEAEGMGDEFTSYLIRSLLSEGRINYETVDSTTDGLKPRKISKEGPTGLITTTTKPSLHPENETRLISITADDSAAQTNRIMLSMVTDDVRTSVDYDKWHAFDRWLATQPRLVAIPFGVALAKSIPAAAVRLRRDFGTVLALIRTHALMHRCSRNTDNQGRVIAELADYGKVIELVGDLMCEQVGQSVSDTTRETVNAVEALTEPPTLRPPSLGAIAEYLKLDKSTTSRRLASAAERGYLHNEETRLGRPSRWRIGDPLPEDVQLFPSVEQLAVLIEESTATGIVEP